MTLTPGVATVDGVINLGTAGSCGIMGLGFGASLGACGAFPALMADGSNDLLFNVPTGASYSFRINNASAPDALHISSTGSVGIAMTNPGEPLDINGIARSNAQFISTAVGAEFRGIAGNYGWMNYSDGSNFYFLLTNSGNQYGTYNGLRPYNINLATGAMSIGNSLTVANGLTADSADITSNEIVGGTITVNGSTITNSTVNVANALLTPTCGSNEALTENSNHTFTCVTIANLAQIGPTVVPNCAGMSPAEGLTWNGTGFSCVAAPAPPPSLWTALGGNIYNTSLSGNVGIGTTGPIVALDVSGAIRAGSSATVTTCSGTGAANGEGSQRYNYTTHAMEYCNGTAWVNPASNQFSTVSIVWSHNGTQYANDTGSPLFLSVICIPTSAWGGVSPGATLASYWVYPPGGGAGTQVSLGEESLAASKGEAETLDNSPSAVVPAGWSWSITDYVGQPGYPTLDDCYTVVIGATSYNPSGQNPPG